MKIAKQNDQSIAQQVRSSLALYDGLDASEIQVQVKDGAVTLEGMAENDEQKLIATEAARVILGVGRVHNKLHVRGDPVGRSLMEKFDDFKIAHEIKSALKEDKDLASEIEVQSIDGIVTLTGKVKNEEEWALAQQLASQVHGIHTLKNNLQLPH